MTQIFTSESADDFDPENSILISKGDPDSEFCIVVKPNESPYAERPMLDLKIIQRCGIPNFTLGMPPMNVAETTALIALLEKNLKQARIQAQAKRWQAR